MVSDSDSESNFASDTSSFLSDSDTYSYISESDTCSYIADSDYDSETGDFRYQVFSTRNYQQCEYGTRSKSCKCGCRYKS